MLNKKLKPKKIFGQNFLINTHILEKIIKSCHLNDEDTVLEIGAGDGRLTRLIAPKVKKLIAVEIDNSLYKNFLVPEFKNSHVELWNGDILEFPFDALPEKTKIIGNLPYNISTPIIEKTFQYKNKFDSFSMTVQLEFGQRLIATPDSKNYGCLSCFVQHQAQPQLLFKINKNSFYPAPKVQSCFVEIIFPKKPLFQILDEKLFLKVTSKAFEQRRKTILNSLSYFLPKKELLTLLESLQIDPKYRAENLSIEDFTRIANHLKNY